MLWQLTRAGVSILGICFIGLGLVEWGRAVAALSLKTAEVLNVSTRTINRDWYKAKALLFLILNETTS